MKAGDVRRALASIGDDVEVLVSEHEIKLNAAPPSYSLVAGIVSADGSLDIATQQARALRSRVGAIRDDGSIGLADHNTPEARLVVLDFELHSSGGYVFRRAIVPPELPLVATHQSYLIRDVHTEPSNEQDD